MCARFSAAPAVQGVLRPAFDNLRPSEKAQREQHAEQARKEYEDERAQQLARFDPEGAKGPRVAQPWSSDQIMNPCQTRQLAMLQIGRTGVRGLGSSYERVDARADGPVRLQDD
jgi:hypothetical protein